MAGVVPVLVKSVGDKARLADGTPFPDVYRRRALDEHVRSEDAARTDADSAISRDLALEAHSEVDSGSDDERSVLRDVEGETGTEPGRSLELHGAVRVGGPDHHLARL